MLYGQFNVNEMGNLAQALSISPEKALFSRLAKNSNRAKVARINAIQTCDWRHMVHTDAEATFAKVQ